jgi:hypothetical protein
MKYILASLPALVSVASAAEIMGTYYVSGDPAPASVAEVAQATDGPADASATGEFTVSAATLTQSIEPTQTPVDATSSWAATEEMPYWHLTQSGYQQMGCGYGYYKDTQGYCQPESWYSQGECYETVIFNKKKYCPPKVVTMTEDVTVYVTEKQPKTIYSTTTEVKKQTDIATNDVTQIITSIELVTSTRIWVSTEVQDQTKTVLHTLTATDTLTSISLETDFATETETATKIEKEVLTKTEHEVETVFEPTTYVSIWLTTEVNNETETLVETKSSTVIDTKTLVKTVDATNTVTETAIEKETTVIPTTIVSKYTTTEVIDSTLTTERVVETTIAETKTAEVTHTESETATITRAVQETGLIGCLYDCKSSYSLLPSKPHESQEAYQQQYDGYADAPAPSDY